MSSLLLDRPAWYVLGPLIGLVVVGLLWTIDERLGVLGGFSNVVERAVGVLTDTWVYLRRSGSASRGYDAQPAVRRVGRQQRFGYLSRLLADLRNQAGLVQGPASQCSDCDQ